MEGGGDAGEALDVARAVLPLAPIMYVAAPRQPAPAGRGLSFFLFPLFSYCPFLHLNNFIHLRSFHLHQVS